MRVQDRHHASNSARWRQSPAATSRQVSVQRLAVRRWTGGRGRVGRRAGRQPADGRAGVLNAARSDGASPDRQTHSTTYRARTLTLHSGWWRGGPSGIRCSSGEVRKPNGCLKSNMSGSRAIPRTLIVSATPQNSAYSICAPARQFIRGRSETNQDAQITIICCIGKADPNRRWLIFHSSSANG